MKTLLNYVKVIAVMAVIGYGVVSFVAIHNNPKAFQDYRTKVCIESITLQDAVDAVRDGEVNTKTKVNYDVKPYVTFVYDTYIKTYIK